MANKRRPTQHQWQGTVVLVLLIIGLSHTLRGYTTFRGDAKEDPDLYYLDRKSLAVIWAPGQRAVR